MIASLADALARPLWASFALAALALVACKTPAPVAAPEELLEPLSRFAARPPEDVDLSAARLLEAALASDRVAMDRAFAELELADDLRQEQAHKGAEPAGRRPAKRRSLRVRVPSDALEPHAQDLVNATLDDPDAYRDASRALLRRGNLDPGLEERLERAVNDDLLRLARRRTWDSYQRLWVHTFNAISRPLGQSLLTGVIAAPYTLAMSGVHWVAGLLEREPLNLQERQALAHRKRFLARYPDSEKAPAVARKVERAEKKLRKVYVRRYLRRANAALDRGQLHLASAMAEMALLYDPGNEKAGRARNAAQVQIDREHELFAASLAASPAPLRDLSRAPEETRRLTEALLLGRPDLGVEARALGRADRAVRDEAAFVLALEQYESGYESASWEGISELAEEDPRRANMARHARALEDSSWRNPYGSFVELRRLGRGRLLGREIFGRWAQGPRYQRLPKPLAYLIDAPAIAQTIVSAPIRLLVSILRKGPDYQGPTSVAGYRYLALHPSGEHLREVSDWLYDYEKERENWSGALRLADLKPAFDPYERAELVEKSATQGLNAADRTARRDLRSAILRDVVRNYPDSDTAHLAGVAAREEVKAASAQRIRLTRSFLEENPQVAGNEGLGIHPGLLDGQHYNGELHPEGVTFLGGRRLSFSLVEASGDEEAPAVKVEREISPERLARGAALVEETAHRNARIDKDDELAADAERDRYFERARLGLTDLRDVRPSAQSTYVFESMRERYGMVRGRESILPFDLVVTGSLLDLSLGAYPRWREPKETPDAFLYR